MQEITIIDILSTLGGMAGGIAVLYMLSANKRKVQAEADMNAASVSKLTSETYTNMVTNYETRLDNMKKNFEEELNALADRVRVLEEKVAERDIAIVGKDRIIEILRKQLVEHKLEPEA